MTTLSERFVCLWRGLGLMPSLAVREWADLARRYGEPHRHYHTLAHIKQGLQEIDAARHLLPANRRSDPAAIDVAWFYHDAIYDTKLKDNEEQSAGLALYTCRKARLPPAFGRQVAAHVVATKHHWIKGPPDDIVTCVLIDADLSILGQKPATFARYERQIREEYAWVPSDAYAIGRTHVLQSFLKRGSIYATSFFRDRYEAAARRNIVKTLKQLAASAS